jgi:hypothetical protein
MKILPFILICLFFSFAQTGKKLNMEILDMIRFQNVLLDSLRVLHQKVKENKFKDNDMRLLRLLADFVHKIGDVLNKQRIEEGPVYWYSRKGR